ncbi:MAG: hypothetical protein L6R40_002532 [Gallowayella cf. fulva]|nr:MAG: hypothetical protein L6R40_002532 [Xanthomendoza cf. fulva]
MRVSAFLTAALSFTATFALPHSGLEPLKGNGLVRRTGEKSSHGGGSGHRSSKGSPVKEDPKVLPGYAGRGKKNPSAPATDKKRVDKMVEESKAILKENKEPLEITKDRPKIDKTGIHEVTREDGTKRFDIYMGVSMAEHAQGVKEREKKYPNSRIAEYRWASDAERKQRRPATTGDGPSNPKDPKTGDRSDGVNEEKPAAMSELIPVNIPFKELPPPTVIKGSGPVSRERDAPLMKMAYDACKAAGPGATMTFKSNLSGNQKMPESIPVKMDSPDAYRQMNPSSSSAGKLRKDPSGQKFRSGSTDSEGSNRRKRDAIDMAADSQTNAESTNPVIDTGAERLVNMQDYMDALGVVKDNATEMIMPFIQDMVLQAPDYQLVWYGAWEIMSLADPSILVIGGPFFRGMHAFDSFEDLIVNKTDEKTMASIYAIDDMVIDLYQTTWNKANDALTEAGLVQDLDVLSALTSNQTLDDSGTDATNQWFVDGLNSLSAANSTSADNSTSDETLRGKQAITPNDSSASASTTGDKSGDESTSNGSLPNKQTAATNGNLGPGSFSSDESSSENSSGDSGTDPQNDQSIPASSQGEAATLEGSRLGSGIPLASDNLTPTSSPGENAASNESPETAVSGEDSTLEGNRRRSGTALSSDNTAPDSSSSENAAFHESLPEDGTAVSSEGSSRASSEGTNLEQDQSLPNARTSVSADGTTPASSSNEDSTLDGSLPGNGAVLSSDNRTPASSSGENSTGESLRKEKLAVSSDRTPASSSDESSTAEESLPREKLAVSGDGSTSSAHTEDGSTADSSH